ncbi:MAG: RNA polymerase sigma-70 factor (ECF subfamily) [Polaribacter sp.]
MTDTHFIKDLKSGNEQAFQQLVNEYKDKVLNTCYGFINNREEAEDLSQEVFIEVFRSISKFKGQSKLSTWIYRIAVTKSLEEIRSRKRQKRAAYFKSLIGLEVAQEIVATKDKDPHVLLEDQQRLLILETAIEKLAENQRISFVLHKYEQLSYKEAAEVMGISLSAVESLIHRAKINLKKHLHDYYKKKLI